MTHIRGSTIVNKTAHAMSSVPGSTQDPKFYEFKSLRGTTDEAYVRMERYTFKGTLTGVASASGTYTIANLETDHRYALNLVQSNADLSAATTFSLITLDPSASFASAMISTNVTLSQDILATPYSLKQERFLLPNLTSASHTGSLSFVAVNATAGTGVGEYSLYLTKYPKYIPNIGLSSYTLVPSA